MFRVNHPEPATASLGACGFPQSFVDALEKLDHTARRSGKKGGLVLISIDNLSMIMSGYSMAVAEAVMGELFNVILAQSRKDAVVARVQRDQFGILIPDITVEDLNAFANHIEDAVRSHSYASRYGELHCICSSSVQPIPDSFSQPEEILGRALVNLTDRTEGYKPRGDISGAEQREEMGLANYIGQAAKEGRMRLAYQPVIDAKTGVVVHYEALLRLFSEDGQISSAGALIPIAERMGFMPVIDQIVLQKVIDELRADEGVTLAVNVSNLSAQEGGWLNLLRQEIEKTPEISSRLSVEITETAIQGDIRNTARFCTEVQALGCSIALDDFGSGYTSFRQLKALSIDYVKIDGSFIRDLTDNVDSRFFVKTLLDFTRGFGLKSVAEFVESGEIAKMLMELGVDYLQGYYFGKPTNNRPWVKD